MESNKHKPEFDTKAERPAPPAPAVTPPQTELKIVYPLDHGVHRPL